MKRATAIGLAHALAGAGTVEEVHDAIQRGLPALLDATLASLAILDVDEGELYLRPSVGVPSDLTARYERVPLDSPVPIAEAVRTGTILVVEDQDAWRRQVPPAVMEDVIAAGVVTAVFVPLTDGTGAVIAAVGVSWDRRIEVDGLALATLESVAQLCEQALERARTTDLAARRASDLARLAVHLADAMTVEEALDVVTTLGPEPVGALATSIGLIDHDAGVLRTHHGESVDEGVSRRFADPPLDAHLAFTDAARTGEAVLIEDYDTYVARYPQSASSTTSLGLGARAAVPICSSSGETLGSIVHAWAGPRSFDEALTSTITTIAEMAGQAIERARLLERIQRDADRNEALAGLAELLAAARTSDEVAGVIALHAPDAVGADTANVAVLLPGAERLIVRHHPAVDTMIAERHTTVSLEALIPHAEVIRDGGMVVFEDLEAFNARYPHLADELRSIGGQTCAVIALPDSTGRRIGALGLAWTERTRIGDHTRATIVALARLCAQALERAQLSDAEHRLVTALRDSVVTPLPSMGGLYTVGRYLPAARRIGMGGDWYQGIALDEHRYGLVVGDVAGHGITAVGEMAQLQAVIGALVRLDTSPGDVFPQTTALLRASETVVTATALLVLVDTAASTITYVAAGHPPPLLRTAEGETIVLPGGRQPMLGVPMDGPGEVGCHPFPPGSILVAYTDGLVERRSEPIDRSIDHLMAKFRDAPSTDADSIADTLLAAGLDGREPDDDVALVVMCRES
ncbi:MAG: SpoIIE family protein phosphatase [Acidimicrobiales bacterium]